MTKQVKAHGGNTSNLVQELGLTSFQGPSGAAGPGSGTPVSLVELTVSCR